MVRSEIGLLSEMALLLVSVFMIIWTPILVFCVSWKKKNESVIQKEASTSENSKNNSFPLPLKSPTVVPSPLPKVSPNESPENKATPITSPGKGAEKQKKTAAPKKNNKKSKEKVGKSKSKEMAKSPKKEVTKPDASGKKKTTISEDTKEKTKTEESDHIVIIKKPDEEDENPKTDLESHGDDLSDVIERQKRKKMDKRMTVSKRKSNEKPESSGYAY